MTIKINYFDAMKEDERLGKEEWELIKMLRAVQARRRIVKKVIAENDEGGKSWIVELPAEALPPRSKGNKSVNWKKLVLQMFDLYKIPMSTELMCNKLWLYFPEVPLDRRSVMQNVSAALSALEAKDQKLFRTRNREKKGFIYGLKHFFDFNMNIKPHYRKQWKREEGEDETLINATDVEVKTL